MAYLALFAAGLAGSLHCVGMCGMFPWTLATHSPNHRWVRQLLYNFGRLNTLVCIGALSGALGAALVDSTHLRSVERGLALLTGAFMIAVGCEMLGLMRPLTMKLGILVQRRMSDLLRDVLRSPSWIAPIALGVFNAFLPCQLIYAFAAHAAATASLLGGALSMLAFGLGTVPAMMAVGFARSVLPAVQPGHLTALSALVVLAFGVATVLRGLEWLPHALLGHHAAH